DPPFQSGDDWLLDVADQRRIFDAIAKGHDIRKVGQRIEIAAGRESALAGASNRHHANVAVLINGPAGALQLPAHFRRHCVHLVSAIEQYPAAAIFNVERDLARHVDPPAERFGVCVPPERRSTSWRMPETSRPLPSRSIMSPNIPTRQSSSVKCM